MANLHQITHPNNLVEQKVNFFANYYQFVVLHIGKSDYLDLENHLSLIEKIIFQIETNLNHSHQYIDSYLTHPLAQTDNKRFKEYKNYNLISTLFKIYQSKKKKSDWIKNNPDFLTSLKKFKTELKKVMFKNALKEIISYLECSHDISEHKEDLIHCTNILVSEFLLNNRVKEDITKTFSRIITNDISEFPFPKSFLEKNKKNLPKAKEEYIKNRTFKQQFEGIYHFLKENPRKEFLIYRVYGVSANKKFLFKYNKVTFYHPKHRKLKDLHSLIKKKGLIVDFLDKKDMLLAIVKVNYFSKNIAEQESINLINKELEFLNFACSSNASLEKYSYLSTSNFKDLGWRWGAKENGHFISDTDNSILRDNPYIFLKDINLPCKNHFLNSEPLHIKAMNSRSPEDYWKYLETLIPLGSNDKKQVIGIVPTLLLLSSFINEENLLKRYLINSISPMSVSASSLGINSKRQIDFFNQLRKSEGLDFEQLKKEINHPFLEFVYKDMFKTKSSIDYKYLKNHYSRTLKECQAQRNSIIHSGQGNEKSLMLIDLTIPELVTRFRWVLFDGMRKYKNSNFVELIEKLKLDATKLLNKK